MKKKFHIVSAFIIFFILAPSDVFSCGKVFRGFNLLDNYFISKSSTNLRQYRSFCSSTNDDKPSNNNIKKISAETESIPPKKVLHPSVEESTYEASSINDIYQHVAQITEKFPNISYSHNTNKKVPLSIRTMFRGQGNIDWKLHPGVIRRNNFDEASALRHLKMIYHSIFNKDPLSINDLSRAQHYGLCTRLLDFSGNLLPSIFFAVEESEEKNPNKESALYILDGATLNEFAFMNKEDKGMFTPTSFETLLRLRAAESKTFNQILAYDDIIESARINSIDLSDPKQKRKIAEKLRFPIAIYPNMDNPRIIAQDGRYVLWGGKTYPSFCYEDGDEKFDIKPFNLEDSEMQYIEFGEKEEKKKIDFLYTIKIKNGYKIKKELEVYGVNRAKLYQSIDETTKWLNDLWKE